ncbi:unnamed protein product [Closterium sp. Naga37s-1]|nr:unnamed protein product [Closterium sp. Naga37s-1]
MDASGPPADSRDAEGEKAALHAVVPPMLSAEEDVEQPQRMQLFMAHLMAHLFCCGTLARPHCDIPAGPPEANDPSPPSRGFVPIDRSMPPIIAVVRNDGGDRQSGGIKGGGERGKRGQSGVGDGKGKNAWRTREHRSAARSGGGRVNIVPRQEAVEEKRAGTAARGVCVGEVVWGSSAEEVGLAAASHMSVREGEHVERGCAAGVGARAAAGRGDSAAAEERRTAGPLSHAHAHPAPTCADLPVLAAVTSGSAPTLGAADPWSDAPFSVPSLPSRCSRCLACPCHLPPPLPLYMMTCTSLCGAGAGLVPPCMRGAAGGTAFNAVAEELHEWTTAVAHVLPVSDDGGSTAEIVRVIGGPAIGDIRSRCLRLSDGSSHEARAVRRLLGHRLPLHPAQAKAEW